MKNLILAFAWFWVAVPLGWGVFQSVQKSLPLFQEAAAIEPVTQATNMIEPGRDVQRVD